MRKLKTDYALARAEMAAVISAEKRKTKILERRMLEYPGLGTAQYKLDSKNFRALIEKEAMKYYKPNSRGGWRFKGPTDAWTRACVKAAKSTPDAKDFRRMQRFEAARAHRAYDQERLKNRIAREWHAAHKAGKLPYQAVTVAS